MKGSSPAICSYNIVEDDLTYTLLTSYLGFERQYIFNDSVGKYTRQLWKDNSVPRKTSESCCASGKNISLNGSMDEGPWAQETSEDRGRGVIKGW